MPTIKLASTDVEDHKRMYMLEIITQDGLWEVVEQADSLYRAIESANTFYSTVAWRVQCNYTAAYNVLDDV